MIRSERLSIDGETFAAERKEILVKAYDRLHEPVRGSMIRRGLARWEDQAIDAALDVFDETAKFEIDEWNPIVDDMRAEFERSVRAAIQKTKDTNDMKAQVRRIAEWLATAAVNAGTEAAVASDPTVAGGLEWRTMDDDSVREGHKSVEGQIIPLGSTFEVMGEQLHYPGEPVGDPAVWINCRCIAQPVHVGEFKALTAAATGGEPSTSAVVVALPAEGDWTHQVSSEDKAHVTLLFLGDATFDAEPVLKIIQSVAAASEPQVSEFVSGSATLGEDKAEVVLVDAAELAKIRGAILGTDEVRAIHDGVEQFPAWIPHLTLGYEAAPPKSDTRQDSITFDRLALWYGPDQTEFPLGGDVPDIAIPDAEDKEVAPPTDDEEAVVAAASITEVAEEEADDAPDIPDEEALVEVPWHGVLAPEGVWSGDKRQFALGSLTNRDLPLPLKYQPRDEERHGGSFAVARIERIFKDGGLVKAEGHFDTSPEAYEVIRLRANDILRGVSVDVDQAEMAAEPNEEGVIFSKGRIASATIVAIPAFAEAFFDLGLWSDVEEPAEQPPLVEVSKLGQSEAFAISEKPWDGSASRFTPEQWHHSCILHTHSGAPTSKSECKLPIREPDGALSRAGVHAAAARFNQVDAPSEAKQKAKASLRSAYKQLGEEPADKVAASLVWEAFADASAPGVKDDGTPPKCKYCDQQATQYVLHSEGMAFVPACDAHIEQAKEDAAKSTPGGEPDEGNIDRVAKYGVEFAPVPRHTKDGPGWITHPQPTTKITDYWVDGRGAAKIGWGAPGDFNRCRTQLVKYVQNPDWLAGLCANLHYRALKAWPGQAAGRTEAMSGEEMAPAASLVASGGKKLPVEAFTNPNLTQVTPFTVTEDGKVFGHIATWDTCHIGFENECKTAPHSLTGYSDFQTGAVLTDAGLVAVGQITMGTGHADGRASLRAAAGHYDHTGYAVADVCAYEDDYGIAVAGMLRPGVSDEDIHALRAAAISGDWRKKVVGGQVNQELVAALAVNVPGFPIPRPSLVASGGYVESVVALSIPHTGADILDDDFRAKMKAYNEEQALLASAHVAREKVLTKAAQKAKARFKEGK